MFADIGDNTVFMIAKSFAQLEASLPNPPPLRPLMVVKMPKISRILPLKGGGGGAHVPWLLHYLSPPAGILVLLIFRRNPGNHGTGSAVTGRGANTANEKKQQTSQCLQNKNKRLKPIASTQRFT